jgi:hypothetical protein
MPRVNRHAKWTHENWPEPYRSAWATSIIPGDVYRRGGRASLLAPRTCWNNERAYGRYREFLATHQYQDKGQLPDIENLRLFGHHLAETLAPYSVIAILTQLTGALRAMYPTADLHYLNVIADRLRRDVRAVRPVDERLISPIELIKIGTSIMRQVDAAPQGTKWAEATYRAGFLIVAGSLFPIRLRNWQMMIIGQHIDLENGRIRFTASEMKSKKKPFEASLPPEVLAPLMRYVEVYRSNLLAPGAVDQGYLFPSADGGPTHRNTLGRVVKQTIKRVTGKDFNMHLFRHAAVTFMSEMRPELTRIAPAVLHHSRLKTTARHYIRGAKRRAFKRYQSAISEIVSRGRRRKPRLSRRVSKRSGSKPKKSQ